jgi:5-methylcytosine-specific restriction protein A
MTNGRPSAAARGYDAQWARVAAEFKQAYPACLSCWAVGLFSPTEIVDHVVPIADNREGRFDPDNLQPCCRWCHVNIKRALEVEWRFAGLPASELRLDSATAMRLMRQRFPLPVAVTGFKEFEWADLKRQPYPRGRPSAGSFEAYDIDKRGP